MACNAAQGASKKAQDLLGRMRQFVMLGGGRGMEALSTEFLPVEPVVPGNRERQPDVASSSSADESAAAGLAEGEFPSDKQPRGPAVSSAMHSCRKALRGVTHTSFVPQSRANLQMGIRPRYFQRGPCCTRSSHVTI